MSFFSVSIMTYLVVWFSSVLKILNFTSKASTSSSRLGTTTASMRGPKTLAVYEHASTELILMNDKKMDNDKQRKEL